MPKIVEHWNSQELIDRASPELMSVAKSPEEIESLFAWFRQLGSLKHLDTPQGEIHIGASTANGSATVANYMVPAEFEKGPATISIQLLRIADTWKINGFRINSNALLPPKNNNTRNDEPQP